MGINCSKITNIELETKKIVQPNGITLYVRNDDNSKIVLAHFHSQKYAWCDFAYNYNEVDPLTAQTFIFDLTNEHYPKLKDEWEMINSCCFGPSIELINPIKYSQTIALKYVKFLQPMSDIQIYKHKTSGEYEMGSRYCFEYKKLSFRDYYVHCDLTPIEFSLNTNQSHFSYLKFHKINDLIKYAFDNTLLEELL